MHCVVHPGRQPKDSDRKSAAPVLRQKASRDLVWWRERTSAYRFVEAALTTRQQRKWLVAARKGLPRAEPGCLLSSVAGERQKERRKKKKKISFWTPAKSGRASRLQGRGTRSCGHRSGPPSGPSASAAACRHMHASTAEAQPLRGTAGSGNPDHVLTVRVRTDGNGVALVPVLLRVARRVWWVTDALICEAPRWLGDCVRQLNE